MRFEPSSPASGIDHVRSFDGCCSTPEVVEYRCGRSTCASPSPTVLGFFATICCCTGCQYPALLVMWWTYPLLVQLPIPLLDLLQPIFTLAAASCGKFDVDLAAFNVGLV